MKRSERKRFINKLQNELKWMKSKENADRMEDKGIMASGIIHDALMMTFDFAEKEGVSLIQLLDWLVIGIAMQHDPDSQVRKDFYKVWQFVEPLYMAEGKRRIK